MTHHYRDQRLRTATELLKKLRTGGKERGCWCPVATNDPRPAGRHTGLCEEVRAFLESPDPREPPTSRQWDVLQFVQKYLETYRRPPSYEEIAEAIGVSSVSAVYEHIHGLADKGYLKVEEGRHRGIRLID